MGTTIVRTGEAGSETRREPRSIGNAFCAELKHGGILIANKKKPSRRLDVLQNSSVFDVEDQFRGR